MAVHLNISMLPATPEPELLNFKEVQEMIPRNQFRQPMQCMHPGGRYENPIPTRSLAPIDSKIRAQANGVPRHTPCYIQPYTTYSQKICSTLTNVRCPLFSNGNGLTLSRSGLLTVGGSFFRFSTSL
jgi:hypothetical protein